MSVRPACADTSRLFQSWATTGTAVEVTAVPMSAATRVPEPLLEVALHDFLLNAEHSARLRVHTHLQPVNLGLAVGLHSRKQQVGKRLVDEEEMIVAMREHHRLAVLPRASLETLEECLESPGARRRIRRQVVRACLHQQEYSLSVCSRGKDLVEPRQSRRLAAFEFGDAIRKWRRAA